MCLVKLNSIKSKVKEIIQAKQLKIDPEIIAVTKTFSIDKITPLLEKGHLHYGENKMQESELKWIDLKKIYTNVQLHMIGKLQSNKAKKAVKLFDYIHSLDNAKLASKINQYENELNKKIKIFIQVNVGDELQKSGVNLSELNNFYNYCTKELSLNIIGLMCIPPASLESDKYFVILKKKAQELNLVHLSMGMSADYKQAILNGSTFLRLGTAIFGERIIK
jgi:PLP dependent protein